MTGEGGTLVGKGTGDVRFIVGEGGICEELMEILKKKS